MKKKLIIMCLVVLGFATMQAQITVRPGVRAGVNFSRFTNSDTTLKTDFYVGGSLAIKFKKFYTLQPEISYSRQGAKAVQYYENIDQSFDPVILSHRTETKLQLDYLTLGIINKFTFGKGFQVMVGPSLDFKVADNFVSENTRAPIDFDLSLVVGVGYAFSNGFGVDARFKGGMIDIFGYQNDTYYAYEDNGYYSNYGFENILNEVIQVGVSYTFDTK